MANFGRFGVSIDDKLVSRPDFAKRPKLGTEDENWAPNGQKVEHKEQVGRQSARLRPLPYPSHIEFTES